METGGNNAQRSLELSQMQPDALLTPREVATLLRVSQDWVYGHARGRYKPKLPALKLGGAVRFRVSRIREFLDHCDDCIAKGIPIQ
jgi:predicted DNA-binding transcriptional regulator AlpA